MKLGLRTDKHKPSKAAFDGCYVEMGPSRGQGYNWIWHSSKTFESLVRAGHRPALHPASELLAPSLLNGPFEHRPNTQFGHEIVSGGGSVVVWVRGDRNARFVCDLLNVAHRHGVVERVLAAPGSGNNGPGEHNAGSTLRLWH